MKEEWRNIQGYEGLYQVSNLGNVRSLDRYVPHKKVGRKFCKGVLMATHINNSGYVTVNLCKCNKYTSYDIHRLVAMAFLEVNDINRVEVNHKDENKRNNCVNNLEWVTKPENNSWGTKIERQAEKIKRKVLQCDLNGVSLKEWESATDAEKELSGKITGAISHCINGKTKTAYGYVWQFKGDE